MNFKTGIIDQSSSIYCVAFQMPLKRSRSTSRRTDGLTNQPTKSNSRSSRKKRQSLPPQSNYISFKSVTATSTAEAAPVKGLNTAQNDVLRFIREKSPSSESGPPITDIFRAFKGTYAEQQIRDAVEYLSNEGHVYSTLDDDHFRATDI